MSGKYKPLNLPQTNLMRFGTCGFPSFPCSTKGVESSYMAFFVIGQILIGAGIAPLFTLVPAYIDENVQPKSMPIYIMVWYCNLLLAPVFGMTSAGFFQGFYIDLKQVCSSSCILSYNGRKNVTGYLMLICSFGIYITYILLYFF